MLAFVHIPKTAGSTLRGLLRRNFGRRHFDTQLFPAAEFMPSVELLRRMKILYPHLESISGHIVRPSAELAAVFPNVRYYTFLREPTARMISAFRFDAARKIQREGWRPSSRAEVADFVEQRLLERRDEMHRYLANAGDRCAEAAIRTLETRVGFVGLVEEFDASLMMLKIWSGRDGLDVRYRRQNVSSMAKRADAPNAHKLVDDFLDDLSRDENALSQIKSLNPRDEQIYNHVRKTIFPKQMEFYLPFLQKMSRESLEVRNIATDQFVARTYRNLIAKPLMPFLMKMSPKRTN